MLDHSAIDLVKILDGSVSYDASTVGFVAEKISSLLTLNPGDKQPGICVALERGANYILVELAAWMAGCFVVPIGADWEDEKIASIISMVSPALIVTDRKIRVSAGGMTIGIEDLLGGKDPLICGHELQNTLRPLEDDDIAYVVFTSGSTGVPKGVMISVSAFREYVDWTRSYFADYSEITTLLISAELTFDIAMGDIAFALAFGTDIFVAPNHRDVPSMVAIIDKYEIGLLYAVPTTHHMLQAFCMRRGAGRLSRLRLIISGGDKFPWSTVENYGALAPNAHFYNVYGPTEFTINCFSIRLDDKLFLKDFSDEVPIGKCFDHLTYALIDAEGRQSGEGELCVAGPQAMKGYLQDPILTASSFVSLQLDQESRGSFYRTGDLAFEAKGHIFLKGRIDGLVKNKGFRVHVDEISRAVETVPWVSQACAVVSGSGDLVVFAKIQHKSSVRDVELEKLIIQSLPLRLIPDKVIFIEDFPLNQSGKVDRKALARSI